MQDAAIVEKILQGDDLAFTKLYHRHARYLATVVLRILGNDAELDDVIQETFINASKHLHDLKDYEKVRPWLVRIAVRQCQKRLKKAGLSDLTRFKEQIHYSAQKVDDDVAKEVLYSALAALPKKNRIPWILSRIQGLSLLETAEACDVSLATVKRRIAKAEARLRSKLDVSR